MGDTEFLVDLDGHSAWKHIQALQTKIQPREEKHTGKAQTKTHRPTDYQFIYHCSDNKSTRINHLTTPHGKDSAFTSLKITSNVAEEPWLYYMYHWLNTVCPIRPCHVQAICRLTIWLLGQLVHFMFQNFLQREMTARFIEKLQTHFPIDFVASNQIHYRSLKNKRFSTCHSIRIKQKFKGLRQLPKMWIQNWKEVQRQMGLKHGFKYPELLVVLLYRCISKSWIF